MMDDVISRKVAINALDKEYRCTDQSDDWDGLKTAMLIIENLPSVQPEPEITDEQAIEHLQSSGWMQRHDKQMCEMGAKEPPQRTGWWINDHCSECGQYVWYGDMRRFCPNCGATMEDENGTNER